MQYCERLYKPSTCVEVIKRCCKTLNFTFEEFGCDSESVILYSSSSLMAASAEIVEGTMPVNLNFFQDRSLSQTSQSSVKCKGQKVGFLHFSVIVGGKLFAGRGNLLSFEQ